MDAGTTANMVRHFLDDIDRYLLRRFGVAARAGDLMETAKVYCLDGHETIWDRGNPFPEGCKTVVSWEASDPVYCNQRVGLVEGPRFEVPPLTDEEKDIHDKLDKAIASQISDIVHPDADNPTEGYGEPDHYIDCPSFTDGECSCSDEYDTYIRERLRTIADIVSPDAETTTNERGGKQSHVPVRFDLIDGKAMFAMAAVLHEGAEKYSPGNWRLIPTRDHLNHALMHIYAYLSGDRTDDHLSHALCRVTFANATELDPEAGPERDE